MSSGGANNTHRPGQQDMQQDLEGPHRLDEASALQGWPQGPAQLAVQSGLLQASLLGGWTSNHNDIYVRRMAAAHSDTATNSILTLAGLQEEARSSVGGAPAPLYILQGLAQVDFGSFMRQEAERLTGQHLTGAQLWQYRFDAGTMAAAGAKQGQGTWQPAVVVAYDDTTGEHELEFTATSMLAGARSRVFLGACGIHFGDSPPAPGTSPNRTPPAHQQQQQEQEQQVVKQEGYQAVTQEPAAAMEASPAADGASADGDQQAAASTEQQEDDRQSADAGGDVSAPPKLEPEPTEEAHNQQQQNGRGGSRRQAALAAPATWAQPSKQRKVGSADGAARRVQHAGDDRADPQADATPAAAAADGSKVSRKKPMQLAKRPQSAPAGQHAATAAAAAAAAAGSDGGAAAVAAAVPPRPNSNRRKQQRPPSRDGGPVDVEPVVPVLAEHPADRSIASARFKNVLWSKRANKWQATVSLAGRYRYFGLYTTQEEAACACDRASLVYKGVNAKVLYYPLVTYLQPDQQQLLQALMQEAHIAASRGTMPPPKMPSGDAGVLALRAASDAQQAAAAAAGEVLQGPPESTLAAIRLSAHEAVAAAALPPVETRPRRRGASSSNLVIGPEDWPAAAAAAGPSRGDSGRRQQRGVSADATAGGAVLRAGSEVGSLGTDGTEGDQGLTAGRSSMRQGRDEGDDSEQADVAAHQPAAAGDGRKRKRKLPPKQGPQKARKAAGGKAAGQAGAASRAAAAAATAAAAPTSTGSGGSPDVGQHGPDVSPAGEVSTATGADAHQQGRASTADMDLDKQQQQQQAAGAGAGAARRKPGGRSSASRRTTPESSVEPEAAGEGGDALPAHGHATRRATGTLRASPGLHGRSSSRKPSPAQLSADKQHSGDSSDIGADGVGAEDDALCKGAAAAATDSESGSDSEEDGEEGDEGAAAAASTRRSQRQAAKRAQRETRLCIASVHNARSDGVWGRLMQRAGGDAQEGSRQRLLMQPAADGDSSEEVEEAGPGRRHDATPSVKHPKGPRASHPAHAAGVSPAGAAGAAAGVSHRPLTRSRTKTKSKGRQRHRPGSAASAAAAAAARGQGRATLISPGRRPLLAAMLAAVADALSDDDQQEDEETDEEAATVAAAAAAAAELRARELVEAVIEEAAAGFPNLPDIDGEEEEDVAQLLLDLNAAAAAAAAHSEDDGSSDAEHAEEGGGDQEDGERDAAGHLVSGPAGEGKAAVRKKRRRERNSGFKYGDQEDWAPGRNRKRRGGKGRGGGPPGVVPRSRGRPRSAVPAPPVTAAAAGGMHAPCMSAFVPPAGFFSMAALQQQQQLADAAAAAGAAGVDSGSDSEGSDLGEGLTAEQRADRQAQKLIQAMTAAFSSGDQASMAQFARLYRRVARNPAAFSQTMAYVFQWGAQMGQNIAASGQSANSMAAAFSSMAAGMGPAGAAAAAAAAAGRTGGAAAVAAAAPGARLRADLVNNRAAGAAAAVGRQAHFQQQQQLRPGAAAAATAGVGASGAKGSGHWTQQYAELLQTSGGSSSSSSVVSDSEDGDARQAVTSSATTPAVAAADNTTAAAAGRSPSKLAAAAAAQAAAAVASLKASGGLKAKLPPVPPCFGTADPQTVRAMMGLPLGSSSDSSSSDSDSGSDDFEIAALAAKAPRCDRVPLVFRSSGAGGARRVSVAGAGVGSTAGGLTSPSTGGDVEMGDADGASRAATEGLEGAAAWPGAAAGFRGSIAGAGRVVNSQGPLQHSAKPAVVTAAAGQQRTQMHVGYSAPGRGASVGRGRGRGRPPGKRQQHGSTQAAPAAAGMMRGYGNPGYVQPGGYSVVLPAGSYYGTALPQAVGGNWQQWQQMAGLQALQQQQQMYQQQQQAYYYLPSQQQQLLLQQQQQQAAARTAAVAFHQQQLLASQQAQKAAAPQQQQQQGPPQLVLNLQQPATQLQPGQLLLSPNSAAKAAAARPAGGHVVGLNLAGPPTSSAPSSSTPPSAGAAAAPPDAAGTASAEGAAAVTSPTSQQQQQPEQEPVPVEPAASVGAAPAAPAAMVEG